MGKENFSLVEPCKVMKARDFYAVTCMGMIAVQNIANGEEIVLNHGKDYSCRVPEARMTDRKRKREERKGVEREPSA